MFSIIVCSIRPAEAEKLKRNIEKTIGLPFEFISYDNRGTGKGICQVYNECAERASYENLCFIHEDVEFVTDNWGKSIAEKLHEDSCGVIGFAGGTIKPKAYSGWAPASHGEVRTNYIYFYKGKEIINIKNPFNEEFSEVIALDGLCLFCKKNNWRKIRFDDKTLSGFHCYDIDFTIATRIAGYKNYVTHTVIVKHFSNGHYDLQWWKENVKLHQKWEKQLPLSVKHISNIKRKYIDYQSNVSITNMLGKNGVFVGKLNKYILGYFATHPFNGRSYKLIGKYLKHKRSNMRHK